MDHKLIPLLNAHSLTAHHFPTWPEVPNSSIAHLFHVNRLETHIHHIAFPLSPHRKTVHDFIFLTQGCTTRSKGLNEYQIGANTFFFLPASQITTHQSISPDAQGFYCHFDLDLLNKGFVQAGVLSDMPFLEFTGSPVVEVPPVALPTILLLLSRLEEQQKQAESPTALHLAKVYLLTLFFELRGFTSASERPARTAAGRITQAYQDALAQHIYTRQSVVAYAELLAVSPNHLNKCVKLVTGKSAQDALDGMLLLESKALLRQSSLSVGEIAFKIGIEDQSSFSRFFKTKTGITPREYRAAKAV
ncbi:MAG: AraC family transcriptional regulator [Hymenobacter sp.]|nr:MAG: AraC family transcriptional regulator [Hymenobacter sp.]